MHSATTVKLGGLMTTDRKPTEVFASNPATYLAGLAVRRTSLNALSVTKSAGNWVGISLGKSLSDHSKTSVVMAGLGVPVLLEATPARGIVTITSYANLIATSDDTLQVGATTFTFKASASLTTEVQAETDNDTTAANLAAKINAHSTAGALFIATVVDNIVTITAKNNATTGASIALVYVDTHSADIGLTVDHAVFTGGGTTAADYVVKGAKAYFSDTTGKADDPNSASTISDAVYVSGVLSGVDEAGNSVACALVDMPAGL